VFGVNGKNFIKTMLKLAENHKELNVVNDQTGSPTYTYDLAVLLVDMVETEKYGRYHATNEGLCTWYEFAQEIFRQAGVDVKVNPVASEEFPAKAERPHNSRMDKSKLTENGFALLPTWQDALKRYLEVI
jgi:dTDP-4-dehydrorhamnose reductase